MWLPRMRLKSCPWRHSHLQGACTWCKVYIMWSWGDSGNKFSLQRWCLLLYKSVLGRYQYSDSRLLLYLCMYTVCKDCTIRIGHICSEGFTCKDKTMFVDALWVHCVGIATDTKSTIIDRDSFNVGLETACNPTEEDSNMCMTPFGYCDLTK